MFDKDIIASVSLREGKKLVLADDTPKAKEPNYYRIGNGTMNKYKIQAVDLITELIRCGKPAQTTLGWIKDGMVWNRYDERIDFIVKVVPEVDASKQVLKKGFKELYSKDLVRRVRRGHYMINPNAMMTDYSEQLKVWDTLVPAKVEEMPTA